MFIRLDELKGGEITVQLYNGYPVTVDTPVNITRDVVENVNGFHARIDFVVMATNEIGEKCKLYSYDMETTNAVYEATIEIQE
jgi:hypothetical protein